MHEHEKKIFDFGISFGDPSSAIGESKKWQENKYFLDEFLSRFAKKYRRVDTTIRNPIDILLQFRKTLKKDRIEIGEYFVLIDITSFPKVTLSAIFSDLLLNKTKGTIFYVEPMDYELPFSIGARYYGLLPFFGSNYRPNRKRVLWVILGFEGERAFSVWNTVEPDETVTFIGEPFCENRRWREMSRKMNELILSSPKVMENYISFSDVSAATEKLRNLHKECEEENLIIAPLGTKLSTISMVYFAQEKENVFVVFSSAERETLHQTIGSRTLVACDFNHLQVKEATRLSLSTI